MIASSPVILQFIVQIHTLRPWEVSDLKNNKLIVQSWDCMACDADSDTPMVKAPRPVLSKNLYSSASLLDFYFLLRLYDLSSSY